ncbi:MAG: hypothetical protein KAQ81_04315 [Deltaproteobacteria bacterium]|nr:hypothetical protein [Deltaproteobacteria bacterium]
MNKNKTIFIIALVFMLLCLPAYADDFSDNEEDTKAVSSVSDQWKFTLIPYFWLPSADADATVAGVTQSVKLTFGDIIDNFDLFGLSGRFEAWKGKWGLILDLMYTDLDGHFENSDPIAKMNPLLNELNVEIAQANVDFALSYHLCTLALREGYDSPALSINLIGGGRYVYLKQEVTPTIRSTLTPKLGKSKDWVEPFIGAQVLLQLTEKLHCGVRGDFGGFGVGSASTKTWNFAGAIGYRFSERYAIRLGYHIYDIDYSNGSGTDGFGLDGKLDGPKLGIMYHF